MAEVAKKRAMRVWSMNTGKREPLFDGVKIEEKWQSALESPTGISLRRGIPVLAVCLFAGQGKLSGGAMPFAPALLAGAMMCGRSVGYAAAGCAVGALLAGSPGTALACALLLLLWVILRCLNLTPNDLTCVAAAGIASYALPALYAVTMQDQLTAAVGAVTAAVLARLYAAALRVKLNGRELLSPEEIISEEPKLKEISYKTIAHLLFDKCDVLVVDKIGKNISGDGMDPNVSGRFVQPKYCSGGIQAEKCVILDLTDETHGNAQGIGLAEVTTRRLFNKMKLEMTYPTGVTNTFLHLMKIPMIMDNDREAMQLALMCCPEAEDHDHMKMIRIPNTAHIGVIEISEGMLPLVENNPNFEVLTEPYDLPFDENGNLF